MLAKRIMSLILGFAFTAWVILCTNIYMVNVVISIFILIAVREMSKAFNNKQIKPISIVSYLTVIAIFVLNNLKYMNMLPINMLEILVYILLPGILILLFSIYTFKHHKYSIIDVSVTLLQIFYSIIMFETITNLYELNNGKLYIWYIFVGSWAPDILAFCVGKLIGKHKFTSISPKKTIEGSIGGIFGGIIGFGLLTYVLNSFFMANISYVHMIVLAIICSIISQIGDLFASSIKRYVDIKDFGKFFPGHGGMLDRFDSTLFVAPVIFAYFYLFM
ncbi:MAG: phosphatidate cytidylyltransferase [Clostridiales bacterium]|nr:phosphatidate cytidylyltransferase [Clostridiales bacterium]